MSNRIHRSTGNVFEDLGFPRPEAERLLIRSDLMNQVAELIRKRRLTQARAAKLMGVSQPRVSDLVRGRIELFSIDMLVGMLGSLGVSVTVTTRPISRRRRTA
ncbi:MAG: helix-turn-helix transcriptional regulator [Gemmatimonadota bacterium]|nr:helix-turn-helix transcriptional regulator [Gemmatimonadota bacterium]